MLRNGEGIKRLDFYQIIYYNLSIMTISKLSEEILLKVFSCFDLKDLCNCSEVNKTWDRISRDNFLWLGIFQKQFPNDLIPPGKNIKQLFAELKFQRLTSTTSIIRAVEQVVRRFIPHQKVTFTINHPLLPDSRPQWYITNHPIKITLEDARPDTKEIAPLTSTLQQLITTDLPDSSNPNHPGPSFWGDNRSFFDPRISGYSSSAGHKFRTVEVDIHPFKATIEFPDERSIEIRTDLQNKIHQIILSKFEKLTENQVTERKIKYIGGAVAMPIISAFIFLLL